MKNTKRPGWSRLDNAAKVFPALANKKDSRVFRFACQLTEPVQKKALQQAPSSKPTMELLTHGGEHHEICDGGRLMMTTATDSPLRSPEQTLDQPSRKILRLGGGSVS